MTPAQRELITALVRRAVVAEARAEQRRGVQAAERILREAAAALAAGQPAPSTADGLRAATCRASVAHMIAVLIEGTPARHATIAEDTAAAVNLWLLRDGRGRDLVASAAAEAVVETVLATDRATLLDAADEDETAALVEAEWAEVLAVVDL